MISWKPLSPELHTRMPQFTKDLAHLIAVARGDAPADLIITGAHVLCVYTRTWREADVAISRGRIAGVGHGYTGRETLDAQGMHMIPGLIDAHVHIESSKLTPGRFAEVVLPHGTTTVVAEPHEIGNVLGVDGVEWFMDACDHLDLDVRFMVPSCVPASDFESSGATIDPDGMSRLLRHPRSLGIGEMMNFPGVIAGDERELDKLAIGIHVHVDGHAPGVLGKPLDAYVAAGILSDHESTTADEARAKLQRGMWVFMREASNARNLLDLLPLVRELGTQRIAMCTDDREPDMLMREGHINQMCRIAVQEGGLSVEDAIVLATRNAAEAHGLDDIGAIAPGKRANLLLLDDPATFAPGTVIAGGRIVARNGELMTTHHVAAPARVQQTVSIAPITNDAFAIPAPDHATISSRARVIGIREGQLLTDHLTMDVSVVDGQLTADAEADIAFMSVVERHHGTGQVGNGLVHGFGITRGAFASTVAHDAHNIVVVGCDHQSMRTCVEHLASIGGGIAVAEDHEVIADLALPVAGLMSDTPHGEVVERMDALHAALAERGVSVDAPFMILSFLALSVIPSLKLTDRGLVDVDRFELVPVAVD